MNLLNLLALQCAQSLRHSYVTLLKTVIVFLLFVVNGWSQNLAPNPFIKHMYTADPSAHVWADGRLYVYPSHDIAPARGADLMDQYHVFSTTDMVNWVDHGEILRASQVPWGRPEGGFMWAPDCAFKNGTYYFYFPHPSGTEWNSTWKIGVATSSSPASGFTVQGYIPGLESLIDPCVFIDDDGQAYFYYGGGGVCKGGKLKSNMMEIDGPMQSMQGLVDFHEASWVHKRNGIYYLSYSDNHDVGDAHNQMRYATSNSPLGPWTHRGVYMDPTDSYTNHGSIVEYKGQWYSFYHNSALSGGDDWLRSICVDKLFFNADGTIQKVIPTKGHGTPYGGTPWAIPGLIEAENYDVGGRTIAYGDDAVNNGGQYRTNEGVDVETCGEGGFNVGFINAGEWMEYSVNVSNAGSYTLSMRVATESTPSSVQVEFGGVDKTGVMTVPATGGWQSYTTITKTVSLSAGQQYMTVRMKGGAFNFNHISFTFNGGGTAPVISSSGTANGTLGAPFSYTISASNNPTSFSATALPPGLSLNTSTGIISGTPTTAGVFNATISATNPSGTGSKPLTITISNAPALNIPGTIQAENWCAMSGVQLETTADTGGGQNVGWIDPGDWIDYCVNVATSGAYAVSARIASPNTGGQFRLQVGSTVLTTINIPNTGAWQTWSTINTTVNLSAGAQTIRLHVITGGFNINWLQFGANNNAPIITSPSTASGTVGSFFQYNITATNSPTAYGATSLPPGLSVNQATGVISGTPTTTGSFTPTISASNASGTGTRNVTMTIGTSSQSPYPGGTPWAIPGTIEVENFDTGGEGVAYHDNDALNAGGQGRTGDGVDTENCSEGTLNIGWTNSGEWFEYTVNVAAGTYNVDVRTASIFAGGTFHIEFNGIDKTGLFTTTNTGAWQTWTTVSKTGITLTGGVQVMRLYLDNANFNINRIVFTSTNGSPTISMSPTSALLNVGSTQQLTVAFAPSNTPNKNLTWSSSNPSVATVSNTGLASGVGVGTATITATAENGGSTTSCSVTVQNPSGTITCYRAPAAITVNGQLTEAGWNSSRSIAKATVGNPNNTATFGVMWDNSNLYVGAQILDANLFSDSPNTWEDDGIEVYIDANNNKLGNYDGLDNQIIKNFNKSSIFTKQAINGLQHAWAPISGGYAVELAIPWSQLGIAAPAQGTSIGFDIGYDDDDNGGARDHQAVWNGNVNNYTSTAAFGTLTLNSTNSTSGRLSSPEVFGETPSVIYWPTIVNEELHILVDNPFDFVEVVDLIGRQLIVESIHDKHEIHLNVSTLLQGLHIVRLSRSDRNHAFRIIKK